MFFRLIGYRDVYIIWFLLEMYVYYKLLIIMCRILFLYSIDIWIEWVFLYDVIIYINYVLFIFKIIYFYYLENLIYWKIIFFVMVKLLKIEICELL